MIKKIFSVAIIALVLFNMAGCRKDPTVDAGKERIIVFFSTEAVSASLIKATQPATGAELTINEVIVFGTDDVGNILQTELIQNPSLSGQAIEFLRRVETIYAIANPSTDMKNSNPANVAALKGLIANFANAPASPFLMSGSGVVDADRYAVIELEKPFAKVEIAGGNGFEIESVTVINTPDKGFVFPQPTFSVPGTAGRIDYPTVNTVAGNKITVYVAENSAQNPTQFLVTGKFAGNNDNIPIDLFYITLQENNEDIDIERNTYYQVIINAKTPKMLSFTKSTF